MLFRSIAQGTPDDIRNAPESLTGQYLTGKRRIEVQTHDFSTREPGIYAVGDVNHYPGKRKLIMSGFHEATLAAYGVAERIAGGPVTLEYTTASAKLHQRLKV